MSGVSTLKVTKHVLKIGGKTVHTLNGGRQGPPGPDLVADRAAIQQLHDETLSYKNAADLDRQATSVDRIQTGSDRSQTGQDVASANAARDTSIAQANLAAGYAASAGSVAQQDLSGVTAAALHRSPNAVVAIAIYEIRNDSDGGAWIAKVDASYLYESLSGKWLGAQASEAAARAVTGAATGDYFQLTTDGKFYKLNAGAGTTEGFRGNKARFPRMAGIVAEASRVVIYDLLEPGRPMWMVFNMGANSALWANTGGNATAACVAAREGRVAIGSAANGILITDFSRDYMTVARSSTLRTLLAPSIAYRNAQAAVAFTDSVGFNIASATINAVAMTTMPDAPVDPVTGLQVPTIAVATSNGLSVIKHDGSVVNGVYALSFTSVGITPYGVWGANGGNWYFAPKPSTLGASFAQTIMSANVAGSMNVNGGVIAQLLQPRRDMLGMRLQQSGTGLGSFTLAKFNESTPAANLIAQLNPLYNTGWMVGDVRRCMFSDVSAGAVAGGELLASPNDPAAWTTGSGATVTQVGGNLHVQNGAANFGYVTRSIATVAGQQYAVFFDWNPAATGTSQGHVYIGSTAGGTDLGDSGNINTQSLGRAVLFTATGAATYITVQLGTNVVGAFTEVNFSSACAAVPDRSYKARPAKVYGTLTKTAVASAAQLVFWGGFSAANYAQEAYSADLDFPSGFALPIWLTGITAAASTFFDRSAAGGGASVTWGTDATGKLTATVVDSVGGTRTVTTSAAYVGVTALLAELSLAPSGTLTIKVNGEVAGQTTGTPLASLANASAVVTWGNNRALTAAFPGGIALARPTATIPSDDASRWIYQQERAMFRDGAQVTLPDSGALVDMDYDPTEDKWKVVSAANESTFVGLVRTASAPVSAGSLTKVAHKGGIKLLARSTTNPGVDVTIPAQNLQEQLQRRAEETARMQRGEEMYDWVGGFTGNVNGGTSQISGLASSLIPGAGVIPLGATAVGATVSGSNIVANSQIALVQSALVVNVNSTNTGTTSSAPVSFLDFILPQGMEARSVFAAGALKQEGQTKDYQRLFDGFRERVRFGTAPGNTAHVRVNARRMA